MTRAASARLLALALAGVSAATIARPARDGCDPVHRALAALDAQPAVAIDVVQRAGRSPDGLARRGYRFADGLEQRSLDGTTLRALPAAESASATLRLAPEGDCESAGADAGAEVLAYDAYAERGHARITLWIDAASGLPRSALRDGPELAWARALSRPTKPPQVLLRATGARSVEHIAFDYDPPAPRGERSTTR